MSFKQSYIFIIGIVLFLCTKLTFAYALPFQKDLDSIIKESVNDVYDNPNKSIKTGLDIYKDTNNSLKIRTKALMLVSLGYTSKRDYQKALEHIVKANELSSQLNDPLLNVEILFRIGILNQQLKIFDKSIRYLDESERLSLNYPEQDSVRFFLGNINLVKGFIYKDNLNCDIALEFFDKGISEYQKLSGTRSRTNLSIAYYNKGNCYRLLSQYKNAKASFYKSIELARMEGANSLISFAQKGLAEVYTLEGKYDQAITLLQKALDQSSNVGDIVLNLGIYKGLFENYLAINEWERYQENHNLYLTTQLDIKKSERNSISDSIEENYKEFSEKEIQLEDNFKTKINVIILIAILIILAIILIEIKNRKSLKTLQNQIEKIQNLKSKSSKA